MRNFFIYFLFLSNLILLIPTMNMAQVANNYEVATWSQFKTAAVTYTFDDNCSNQLPVALPLFDQYNFKVTFFSVVNWGPNWNGLKQAANNGHEVGSHTLSHPSSLAAQSLATQDNELKQSQATINTNIPNAKCLTIAYPNCNRGDLVTTQKYYIAGRGCQGAIESSKPADLYNLSSIITGNTGSVQKAADFNNKVLAAKSSKGWCVFLTHGIDNDGGYSPTQSAELKSHLSFMNTNKADYWVATFANTAKYIRERNAASLTETVLTADSLRLNVTDNLDNSIYNYPLTIRRVLPSGWQNPKVYVNGTLITSTLSTTNGVTSIVFEATPDQGTVVLANGNTVSTNLPPVVNLTSPLNQAIFTAPATITINATATDADGTVSTVQFFNGTTLLGSDATAPYSFSFTNVVAGTYLLKVVATDNKGATASSQVVTIVVNNPSVTRAPFNGTPLSIPGTIQIEEYDLGGEGVAFHETTTGNSGNSNLRASDPVDIETTTDEGGGINVGWIATGEWLEYTVNVMASASYILELRVAAADATRKLHIEMDGINISGTIAIPNTGGYQSFQTVTVNNINLTAGQKIMRIVMDESYFNINYVKFRSPLPNVSPAITIISPDDSTTFTAPASITINASAIDTDGTVSNVKFYNGTTLLATDVSAPYSFTWTAVAEGAYTITAVATDNSGATATSQFVTVLVGPAPPNVMPVVSITAPYNTASFTAPASITISATATDADGTVSAVRFYNGSTLLGTDATAPYSFSWTNVNAGTYTITAVATDNNGSSATSAAVNITVLAAPAGDISGPDCGVKNTSGSYALAAANKTGATSYSWWYTGSAQSLTPVAGDASKVTVNFGNSFAPGNLCVGVNYSIAPWFKQYCKAITSCNTKMDESLMVEDMNVAIAELTIAPNPSTHDFMVTFPQAVQSYALVNDLGTVVKQGGVAETGASLFINGDILAEGLYTLIVRYQTGETVSKKVQKLK